MLPASDLYLSLGVSGNRVPKHLTNLPGADLSVQLNDDTAARVLGFGQRNEEMELRAVAEKIHPESVRVRPAEFSRRLDNLALDRGVDVSVVYLVREPARSLASFQSYQNRGADWYTGANTANIIRDYMHAYSFMQQLILKHPGPIVTYEAMASDLPGTLEGIFRSIDLIDPGEDAVDLVSKAIETHESFMAEIVTSPYMGLVGSPGVEVSTPRALQVAFESFLHEGRKIPRLS